MVEKSEGMEEMKENEIRKSKGNESKNDWYELNMDKHNVKELNRRKLIKNVKNIAKVAAISIFGSSLFQTGKLKGV